MGIAAAAWLLHLVALAALGWARADAALVAGASRVGAQVLTVCVALLLATSANVATRKTHLVLLVQLVAGAATLTWLLRQPQGALSGMEVPALRSWMAINLLGTLVIALVVAHAARKKPTQRNLLAATGAVLGLVFWLDGLVAGDSASFPVTFSQCGYAVFLLAMWHLGNQRISHPQPDTGLSGFAPSTGFEMLSGFGPAQDIAATAVATERRRIAQDLHDNVGAQIVNILSSLDTRGSQAQVEVALALEQCLLDLKMTVDAIDSVSDSVPEALGRLRQRVQRSLDVLGIKLAWKVQVCDELDAARGVIALNVLRIAQECLTNVMRHSRASTVEVVCRFAPDPGEVVLEVRDNGCGMDRKLGQVPLGKGLESMRRRAAAAGGVLVISSKVGAGSRVRLNLPFHPELSR